MRRPAAPLPMAPPPAPAPHPAHDGGFMDDDFPEIDDFGALDALISQRKVKRGDDGGSRANAVFSIGARDKMPPPPLTPLPTFSQSSQAAARSAGAGLPSSTVALEASAGGLTAPAPAPPPPPLTAFNGGPGARPPPPLPPPRSWPSGEGVGSGHGGGGVRGPAGYENRELNRGERDRRAARAAWDACPNLFAHFSPPSRRLSPCKLQTAPASTAQQQ